MALIGFEGFEGNSTSPEFIGATVVNGAAKTGNGYHEADSSLFFQCPNLITDKLTTGAACQFTNTPSSNLIIFQARGSADTEHLTLIQPTESNATLKLALGSRTGTIIADTGFTPVYGAWYYIELQTVIHPSAGSCIVRVDGVDVITYSGQTTPLGSNEIAYVYYFNSVTGGSWKQDDIYVLNGIDDTGSTGRPDNDFLGTVRVEALYPSDNGISSDFIGSDLDSTDNYELVNEYPIPNTNDYVYSNTNGDRDLYEMYGYEPDGNIIYAVRQSFYAQKSDTNPAFIKSVIKEDNGTGAESVSDNLNLTYGTFSNVYGPLTIEKPSGGAWTETDLFATQFGAEMSDGS